ncbi:acyl-CoA thioesterase [Homoserinimonas sp. A447]
MLFRTILLWIKSHWGPRFNVHDVGRLTLRVLPTDLDVNNHVNNGVYFSLMDLGRFDLLHRSGAWATMMKNGFYPVVASETITFRKSLAPWQRYVLESKIVGYDEKAVYLEQRFVVDGEIYAQGYIRGRFLKKSGGTVSLAELAQMLDVDLSEVTLPSWLAEWADDVAMPSTREEAPSVWD